MAKALAQSRDRLKLSKISAQTQLLSTDIDLRELSLFAPKLPKYRIEEAVVAGSINRTIEGASTVTLTLNDRYGFIKNSGRLGNKVDIKIDGLWFRLVKVQKSGFQLTLTFESREVAILRTYMKFRASAWNSVSRTRFAQILVNEVREFRIPFICPELKFTRIEKRTAKQKAEERDVGMSGWIYAMERARLNGDPFTIKNAPPNSSQVKNIDTVLQVGMDFLPGGEQGSKKRKLMVCSIMTGIVEANCHNKPYGDVYDMSDPLELRKKGSVGFFQQQPSWGTFEQRMDLLYSTRKFLEAAQAVEKAHPGREYGKLCQDVQGSAHPEKYALWRKEAERWVTAFGAVGGDSIKDSELNAANNMAELTNIEGQPILQQTGIDKYQFMRGRPKEKKKPRDKEDSWTCLQRLADEVNWRCFECSGAIYFMSEPRLFKSSPRVRLNEESEGVDWINYDYDVGKKNAVLTLEARLERWAGAPGTVIEIHGSGVSNGRWIVNDIDRNLFDNKATVTLKKPRPILPEPKQSDVATIATVGAVFGEKTEPPPGTDPAGAEYVPLPLERPNGKALRDAVIDNQNITFTRDSQKHDIAHGLVKPRVLQFMWSFMWAGFSIMVTATRSDHPRCNPGGDQGSLHCKGLALDMGNYTDDNPKQTKKAMNWIRQHKLELHIDELICHKFPLLNLGGPYDQKTVDGHDDHIHVGVFPG